MRKIAMSLGMLALGGAALIGATGAFFSDTETSSANVFTAGAIDLTVDSTSHYAGLICTNVAVDAAPIYQWQDDPADATPTTRPDLVGTPCSGTWTATDLGASNQFFNFADVKPGDPGEDTVSLHINNNDAWACMDIRTDANNENTAIEPELTDGDTAANGPTDGELAQNLNFITWLDNASTSGAVAGDNIHQVGETILSGPQTLASILGATTTLPLADSTTGSGPMIGGATSFVGIAWCVGTQTVDAGTGVITCDGSAVGNTVQTDSATSTVSFRVVQSRNNPTFTCNAPVVVETAASFATGFELGEGFAPGNINGQGTPGAWKKTGSYDAAVVNSPVIANLQSLRISNAVTSGAFGDQTFAPDLAFGAGETGVGDSENHFEAQFDASSTLATLQPGLALSVSPDNGSGARMSYLRFEDHADGIHVFFDDVTDPTSGTAATFNESDIATITRSAHTIKFVMDFVDGPANDVVKIYIDGVLKKTGTSWEDYYRNDPEQAGGGNVLSEVDTLIFRAGGTAAPATSGNGFLFDKVSMMSGNI